MASRFGHHCGGALTGHYMFMRGWINGSRATVNGFSPRAAGPAFSRKFFVGVLCAANHCVQQGGFEIPASKVSSAASLQQAADPRPGRFAVSRLGRRFR